jgi:hypothetical protein
MHAKEQHDPEHKTNPDDKGGNKRQQNLAALHGYGAFIVSRS